MSKRRQRGFTLAEVIIFIVVVSLGMAGILSVMNTTVKSSADPMLNKQSLALAESLLEEILLKDFAKPPGSVVPGAGSGGARTQFDCVDDYNTYKTTGGMVDGRGNAVSGLSAYNYAQAGGGAGVVVAPATVNGTATKRVTVFVTGPDGITISLIGYRASY